MRNLHVFLVFSLLVFPAAVSAQTREESARAHFESGNRAFAESRWIDCAQEFEQSFAIVHASELLYNVGACYQRAAGALPDAVARPLLERALAAYQRYLRELPEASDAVTVRTVISDLTGRLARMPSEAAVAPEPEPQPDVAPTPEPPVEALPEPEEPVLTVPRGDYTFTIAAGALTLVSAAIAIGLGVHASDLYSNLSATCGQTVSGCSEAQISEISSFALGANIMYAVSGIALIGTGLSFAFEFTATEGTPTRAYLSVSGRF